MAEYTLGWCLWVTQRMERFRARSSGAAVGEPSPASRCAAQTLCVVGLGDIGRAIARAARALGMRVIGVTRSGRRGPGRRARLPAARAAPPRWPRRLRRARPCPLSAATRGLIGAAALAAMKPVAPGCSTSAAAPDRGRGGPHRRAPRHGASAARCSTSSTREPLPADHPLWALDNAVITPAHLGAQHPREIAPIFNDNLRRYLAGRPLRHVVDRAAATG